MIKSSLNRNSVIALARKLGAPEDFEYLSQTDVALDLLTPEGVAFRPDFAILSGELAALGHVLAGNGMGLPDRIVSASPAFKDVATRSIIILAVDGEEESSVNVAERVATKCVELGFGLAVWVALQAHLVFPPSFIKPVAGAQENEFGHIPQWLIRQAVSQIGISDCLRNLLANLEVQYKQFASAPGYEQERQVLMHLAEGLASGMPKLFCPVNRLNVLAEYETTVLHGGRDHFFHTFNNWLLGCCICGALIDPYQASAKEPESYVAPALDASDLHAWEALWTLTALFHDEGYLAEQYHSLFSFAFGIPATPAARQQEVTEAQAFQLSAAWETDFLTSRTDLLELWGRASSTFFPGGSPTGTKLDSALRDCYFDGSAIGHSVASALILINRCRLDPVFKGADFDHERAIIACEIAGLCMIFHDPYARNKLRSQGFNPVGFDRLPYAGVLAFVDSIQDDRRDVARAVWPTREMLVSVSVDAVQREVVVQADLTSLDIRWWAWKISEYESVIEWLNASGSVRFDIQYAPSGTRFFETV